MSGCVEIHSSGIHEFLFVQSSKSEEKVKKKFEQKDVEKRVFDKIVRGIERISNLQVIIKKKLRQQQQHVRT